MQQRLNQKLRIDQHRVSVVPLDRQYVVSIFFRRRPRLRQGGDATPHHIVFLAITLVGDDGIVEEVLAVFAEVFGWAAGPLVHLGDLDFDVVELDVALLLFLILG